MTSGRRANCVASMKIREARAPLVLLAGALAAFLCGLPVGQCQFLQPQSHLGRLVQSIASPLVLSSGYAADSGDSDESPAGAQAGQAGGAQHFQHYQREQQSEAQAWRQQPYGQALQQAPSQERGVPQHFYARQRGAPAEQADEEDAAAPSSPHKQRSAAAEEYRMGAYLGPTIDDKEIQGAFNSKDDERDDDEGAAGFMGPPSAGGRQRAASAAQDVGSHGGAAWMGPAGEQSYGQHADGAYGSAGAAPSYRAQAEPAASFDDESAADEDDEPRAAPHRRGPTADSSRFRTSGQAAAASHFHQQRRQHAPSGSSQPQQQQQQMQAAANGYAPYGYPSAAAAGPIDLSNIMAGPAGYEVYNGDGSFPGAGYYQQQGNGRRNQAASNTPGAGPYGPYGPYAGAQQQEQRSGARGAHENDDQDADADEDRA